jgi:hypothetical protein
MGDLQWEYYKKETGNIYPFRLKDADKNKLLIHENWHDLLKPVYDYMKAVSGAVAVEKVPEYAVPALELLGKFAHEFGYHGWLFTISTIYIFKKAISKAFEVGKFTIKVHVVPNRNYGEHDQPVRYVSEVSE